ncbi:MAG: HAD family hydrolase [Thalassotalea sp.]
MAKIKGVLFDLDGTILDTADDLGGALNQVLSQYGLPLVAATDYRPIASDGAKGLLELGFSEQLKDYDFEHLRTQFLAFYEENIATQTKLYHGVSTLLTYLDDNNIPWGIVTNKPEGLSKKLVPCYHELNSSQVLVGGDSLAKRKPHPLPLLYALEKINVASHECFYVGDAPRDIEAGKRANMPTIIAGWGYISDLTSVGSWQADHLCHQPEEIIALLS